jgi:16S rRNA (guanine1207-N2)-methyltransferase
MFDVSIDGVSLELDTAPTLFSSGRADAGTLAMLSCVGLEPQDKILDLGCGYGLVGLYAAKRIGADRVWMSDNDPVALGFARRNADKNGAPGVTIVESDGFHTLHETDFSKILCNPPYHVDFSVPKHFIEKGFNRLAVGGAMFLVTKRKDWYRNKLRSIFGGARIHARDSYFVFEAIKKSNTYAKR